MTKKRQKELRKKREEKLRLLLTPACGKTGKVRKARCAHECVACKKAHKIRPGQLYVARSVFIRPPKYPIQLSYCASASKKYAALPSTQERALARMAGVKIPDEPPKFQRAGIKVTDFEQMCETYARSYRFMKRNIWESLRRWKEAHADER